MAGSEATVSAAAGWDNDIQLWCVEDCADSASLRGPFVGGRGLRTRVYDKGSGDLDDVRTHGAVDSCRSQGI